MNENFSKKNIRILKEIGRNAYVDWVTITVLFFLVAIVLVGGSTYLYFAVTKGRIQSTQTEPEPIAEVFNKKELERIITLFDKKLEKSEKAGIGYSGIEDPSQ